MSSNRVTLGDGWFLRLDRLENSYLWLSTVAQGQVYKGVGINVSFPPLTSPMDVVTQINQLIL